MTPIRLYLPLADCKVGWLYRVRGRNLNFAVFLGGGFIGLREKFGQEFLEIEYHYDTAVTVGETGWRGTLVVMEELELCPVDNRNPMYGRRAEEVEMEEYLRDAAARYARLTAQEGAGP